jgi:hypothetical protein
MKHLKRNRFILIIFALTASLLGCKQRSLNEAEIALVAKAENNWERRAKEEFDMLKNPVTGKIPEGIRQAELLEAATIPLKEEISLLGGNAYTFQGPNNLGGRCRAVAYDMRFNGGANRVVLAGGVSGGMFRSTDAGANWTRVSSLSNLHSVTSVAQDPRPGFQDTWYFGTGENLGNSAGAGGSAFYYGYGIFKSTDNGTTWTQLAATAPGSQFSFDSRFDLVSKIVVNPVNGDVYAATLNSISMSTNGGTSWNTDLGAFGGNSTGITDVVVTTTGIVYASINGLGSASASNQGVWRKAGGIWTRIAEGTTPAPTWWNTGTNLGRIVLATVPGNANQIYALYFNGITSSCAGTATPEAELGFYDHATATWTDLSANLPNEPGCSDGNDPFAVQGGYDLVIAVKPDNPAVVFIGGTNAYRSTDGFTTPNNTTRIGGYASAGGYALYPNHHADVHAFAFMPNNPNMMLCGTDGGLHEGDITAFSVSWVNRNTNFTTFQYYYAAIDPTAGSDKYIGGTQDNGTNYRKDGNNAHVQTLGGDGVSVGISNNNTDHYVGTQRGNVYRKEPDVDNNFINATLTPPGLSASRLFVTLFHLDPDNSTVLYYADFNEIWRNTRADTVPFNAAAADRMKEMTGVAATLGSTSIRSFATSRGAYNAATSKLYFGTNDGRVFRLDNPRDADLTAFPVVINNGSGMPAGAIMGIGVNPRNADTIVATIANYSTTSIWFCGNATSVNPTWTAIEGNLTLPSIRSAAIVVNSNSVEYYVGTSTGLYSTANLNGNATQWVKEGADIIGNAVVVDLKLRPADNKLLIATHGNGLFTTDAILPVKLSTFKGQIVKGKSELNWITQTETNNRGFDIEKSTDGRNFNRIGFVAGMGTSTMRNSYSFTDPAVLQRVQYFRLKQLDRNGRYTYSQVVKLTQDGMPLQLTHVVNPATTNLIFTLNDAPRQAIQVTLLDAAGRAVLKQGMPGTNSNVFRLNIANLPNGIYTLWLQGDGLKETRRIIKQL